LRRAILADVANPQIAGACIVEMQAPEL